MIDEGNGLIELDEPVPFQMALRLTFSILGHAIRKPYRRGTPFARPSLSPYIDIILTLFATCLWHERERNGELFKPFASLHCSYDTCNIIVIGLSLGCVCAHEMISD
jgi:hypothetical protein